MNGIMFLLGLLFGFGLLLSGMSNPQKVQDFLDVFGRWDASLAFVMGGAILVTLIAFRGSRSAKPLLCACFSGAGHYAHRSPIAGGQRFVRHRLGLAGICPGPALVLAGMLRAEMLWFGGAILAGMWLFRLQKRP